MPSMSRLLRFSEDIFFKQTHSCVKRFEIEFYIYIYSCTMITDYTDFVVSWIRNVADGLLDQLTSLVDSADPFN